MSVVYRYSQFFTRDEDEEESVDDALRHAWVDTEHNHAYPVEILVDGNVAYDRAAMQAEWKRRGWDVF